MPSRLKRNNISILQFFLIQNIIFINIRNSFYIYEMLLFTDWNLYHFGFYQFIFVSFKYLLYNYK